MRQAALAEARGTQVESPLRSESRLGAVLTPLSSLEESARRQVGKRSLGAGGTDTDPCRGGRRKHWNRSDVMAQSARRAEVDSFPERATALRAVVETGRGASAAAEC